MYERENHRYLGGKKISVELQDDSRRRKGADLGKNMIIDQAAINVGSQDILPDNAEIKNVKREKFSKIERKIAF